MKWLTGIYLFILGVIVFLADQKQYQPLFRRVREMPYGDKLGHLILMGLFSLSPEHGDGVQDLAHRAS